MTAPSPIAGPNPWGGTYQNSQYDNWVAGGQEPYAAQTVFGSLVNPTAAGVAAAASPSVEFAESTDPTVGASDDEDGGDELDGTEP
jgi:hypothetical protein